MTRALVLGATGHIGAHVVRALLRDGHDVRTTYRTERFLTVLDGLPVERVRVDLDTCEGLRAALEGCAWVFHAAAYYPSFQDRRADDVTHGIASTRRVLDIFREAGPDRIVFTSSAATIRRVPGRAATEADAEPWPPTTSRPLYATVKIAIEHEVLRAHAAGLPIVIVNPSVCLGEYDAHRFSGRAILAFATHRLPVYLDHRFNAVYTGDVGVGHVRAAQRGRIGERYLLTHRHVTLLEFATMVAHVAGVPPPRWRIPLPLAQAMAVGSELAASLTRMRPMLTRDMVSSFRAGQLLDGTKALVELGLPQTSLEEAIRRAVDWFKAHGDL